MSYFILWCSEDGLRIDGPFAQDELLARITPDQDGGTYYNRTGFYSAIPESDKGYWLEREGSEKLLIIKGDVVVPTPKQTVVEWELPAERPRRGP